jgi:membrane protein implicated in regulation of membrane protease activity
MEPWLLWALVGIALLIGEVLTGTLYLAALAAACLLPALLAALGLGPVFQVGAFATSAILLVLKARPVLETVLHPPARQIPSNVAALVGSLGHVSESVAAGQRPGRVLVGGDDWRAVSADGRPIEAGAQVVVMEVQGVTLTVARDPNSED